MKLGGKVEPENMRITVGRDLAIISNYEIGHNVTPEGNATNLFRRKNGKWEMIGHHTGILPFL